ncbi:MAG: FAD-binding protein [Propionibacteriales bacterium]|nr:FAD-binding protein [Propionibacteriales bacterium]
MLGHLRKACDDRVRVADAADAVDGTPCRYVALPASTGEVAELLRVAAEHGLRVVARGAGTKQCWGRPPEAVDVVVEMAGLAGVVEHAAGDLITIARAGTPMAELQRVLATAHQQLAVDTPLPGATLGGTVATSTSGPRRFLYGTLRDLLIGITFVRADGVVAKAGGKVVKNVAGYDFGKLLTGSYGTLGVITEVALRLHPLPPARRFVTVPVADAEAAGRVAAVLGSQVAPTAVEVDRPSDGGSTVAVLLEGVDTGVETRAKVTADLLGPASVVGDAAPGWFGEYPFGPTDIGLKLTTTLTGVGALLAAVRGEAAAAVSVRGSAAGVLYAGLPGGTDPDAAAAVVERLRARAAELGGSVVVLTGPRATRERLDVWGPVGGLDLMRRLKHELDPDRRLAPGRFVGGI